MTLTLALILTPAVAGLLSFALPWDRYQRWLLLTGAAAHLALTAVLLLQQSTGAWQGYLLADAIGRVFLGITSLLFFVASLYAVGYLQREVQTRHADWVEGELFSNAPERLFVGCMLLFLSAMTLVTLSHHFGLLWVAIEATTLASAPLIYFHRHHRSLEATWKYVLIASVGIALALLGTYFLAVAATQPDGNTFPLYLEDLTSAGSALDPAWLRAAFVLLLVGYGTKMGLAPFHTWLPDAHSESPSLVSALMSGALLNCAFVGLLRAYQVMAAAGQGDFARQLLVLFGLISMGVAAVFIIRQSDYKRLLAYSSVEHMGILALGVGIGGGASFGAMFHAVNHSLAKGLLFLVAGNILAVYHTTATRGVRGVLRSLPVSGVLWVVGFLAITGSPPFGSFLSEFTILQAAVAQGRLFIAGLYLVLLALIFLGMGAIFLSMAQGSHWEESEQPARESWLAFGPPAILAIGVLLLGLYVPPGMSTALHDAATLLGGAS